MKFKFFLGFYKSKQILNFVNIRPVGANLFNADGQTETQTWRS